MPSLEKLNICAYKDHKFNDRWKDRANPVTVMINPASYKQKLGACFTKDDAAGTGGMARAFNKVVEPRLQLELVFDGTGAIPWKKKTVPQQIEDLRRVTFDINSQTHRPNFVILSWGTLLFKGQLETLDINYTLFDSDGMPLRARVTAIFQGFRDKADSAKAIQANSPDLTHRVVAGPGETLSLLSHRVYGDSRYYLGVAAANGLDGFRGLSRGAELFFPPLAGGDS